MSAVKLQRSGLSFLWGENISESVEQHKGVGAEAADLILVPQAKHKPGGGVEFQGGLFVFVLSAAGGAIRARSHL